MQLKLNEPDDKNDLPLDLALRTRQQSIAKNLVKNHVDVNKTDSMGLSLLHKAIVRNDDYSASFLVDHGVSVNLQDSKRKQTALMYLAGANALSSEMLDVVRKILKTFDVDVNIQDVDGNTALHTAISVTNTQVFKEILAVNSSQHKPNLNIKNKLEQTVLWLALLESEKNSNNGDDFNRADSFPNLLIAKGCELNVTDSNGDSLLHACARKGLEKAAIFLVNKQAKINLLNGECESVLHVACENGLADLVKILLEKGTIYSYI